VSGAFDTTSNMYSSVYSTTSAGAGVSDRCPTPPRSTPPLGRSKVSGNEYSDSSYTDLATSPAHTVHTSSYPSYTSSTYTVRTAHSTKTLPTTKPVNFRYHRSGHYCDLPLEWWERTEHCKEAKLRHTDRIDHMCGSRESLVLKTTLWKDDIVLEPNMFPCKCSVLLLFPALYVCLTHVGSGISITLTHGVYDSQYTHSVVIPPYSFSQTTRRTEWSTTLSGASTTCPTNRYAKCVCVWFCTKFSFMLRWSFQNTSLK